MKLNLKLIIATFVIGLTIISTILFVGAKPTEKPKLALMSSISLILGEVSVEQMVAGKAMPAPAYDILRDNYNVTPLDAVDDRLKTFDILLLAQARALRADELVTLDEWVRSGGNVMILSDAALQWPSEYSLGDKRKPLFTSFLSPLFTHWGIEQILLMEEVEQQTIEISGYDIKTVTPGEWIHIDSDQKQLQCNVSENKFEALCNIGEGRAIIVADSDFIYDGYWNNIVGIDDNMAYLLDRLNSFNAIKE